MGKSITVADKNLGGIITQNPLSNTKKFLVELQTSTPQTARQQFCDPKSPERMLAVNCKRFLKKDTGRHKAFLRKQKELRKWIAKQSETHSFSEWASWCYQGQVSGSEAKLALEADAAVKSF